VHIVNRHSKAVVLCEVNRLHHYLRLGIVNLLHNFGLRSRNDGARKVHLIVDEKRLATTRRPTCEIHTDGHNNVGEPKTESNELSFVPAVLDNVADSIHHTLNCCIVWDCASTNEVQASAINELNAHVRTQNDSGER